MLAGWRCQRPVIGSGLGGNVSQALPLLLAAQGGVPRRRGLGAVIGELTSADWSVGYL